MNIGEKSFLFFVFFVLGVFVAGFKIPLVIILIGNFIVFLVFIGLYAIYQKSQLKSVGFLILVVFLGAFYLRAYDYLCYAKNGVSYNKVLEISGSVFSLPQSYQKLQSFKLKSKDGVFLVKTDYYRQLNYGDEVRMIGIIKPIADSDLYLKKEKVLGVINFPEIISYKKSENHSLTSFLYSVRVFLSDVYKKIFNKDASSLITGILLGQESAEFLPDFKLAMKNSGTTHITALSGYNITILISALFFILSFILPRKINFLILIAGIVLFVIMTGAQSSVIRAAIMGSFGIVAQRFSRIYSFKQAMAASAFFMLLFNPFLLRFDIGFILSFLSLAGITYLAPIISSFFSFKNDKFEKLKKLFLETLSAQLSVLGVLCFYFGGFSLTGLVANLLVLPLIPFLMAVGFLVGFFGFLWMPLGWIFSFLLYLPLEFEVKVIKFFGSIPQVQIKFGFLAILIYYLFLLVFIIKNRKRIETYEFGI
jgi:competence protein ComEC